MLSIFLDKLIFKCPLDKISFGILRCIARLSASEIGNILIKNKGTKIIKNLFVFKNLNSCLSKINEFKLIENKI